MMTLPLTTDRLTLRSLCEGDLDAVFEILSDEVTTERVSWRQPTRSAAADWLAKRLLAERVYGISMLAIEHRASAAVVGFCGFFPRGEPRVELGYVIHARHWGKGLATEAVTALVKAASEARLAMFATIRPWNIASLRVAEKAGLVRHEEIEDDRGTLLVYRN